MKRLDSPRIRLSAFNFSAAANDARPYTHISHSLRNWVWNTNELLLLAREERLFSRVIPFFSVSPFFPKWRSFARAPSFSVSARAEELLVLIYAARAVYRLFI